jgi:chlorophyllide a reductase subunit X
MSTPAVDVVSVKFRESQLKQLRAEAAIEPDPVPTGDATKQTQIIAIYGKGGSGKSFALSNLSAT